MLDCLHEHHATETNTDIAKALGISRTSVHRKAAELGLRKNPRHVAAAKGEEFSRLQESMQAERKRQEAAGLVTQAMESRTPIELAWARDQLIHAMNEIQDERDAELDYLRGPGG